MRSEVATHLRSGMLLIVAIAIAGGATLTALAGARRAESAVDRFVAYSRPGQAGVFADPAVYPSIRRLPEVEGSAKVARFGMTRIDGANRPVVPNTLGAIGLDTLEVGRPIVVAGRLPRLDRTDEVAVNASAARNAHIKIGDELRFRAYLPGQEDALLEGSTEPPTGPIVVVRVTGVVRAPTDLSTAQPTPDVIYTGNDVAMFTPAFLRDYGERVAAFGGAFLIVRLEGGNAALPKFRANVARLSGGEAEAFVDSDDLDAAAQARHATGVEALALLLFGILAGVVTLTLIAQAFSRQVYLDLFEYSSLRAMGMTRKQLVAAIALRALLISVVGAALATVVAILASPRMPIGLARQAEVDRGYSVDGVVLLAGVAVIATVLTGWSALVAWRVTGFAGKVHERRLGGRRVSRISRALSQVGSPPSATVGAGLAFETGRGASAVPVRTALLSAITAVTVVAGALTFGANLSRLSARPALQGWTWDVAVGNPHSDDVAESAVPLLENNPAVASFSAIGTTQEQAGRINGREFQLIGIDVVKGDALVPYTAGRPPRGLDEIAFGAKTMSEWHLAIGQRVRVSAGGPTRSMLITGRVLLTPSVVNNSVPFGQAAVVTGAALRALEAFAPVNVFLVRLDPDADHAAALRRLRADFPGTVLPASRPPDIENLRRVDNLPGLLAALFALIAVLIVGNMLVSSVRRRRREIAVLRTIGFVRRQVSAVVAWQATMLAGIAVVIGIPIGIVAGRAGWTLVTRRLGLPAEAIVPAFVLFLVALAALVVANLIAVVPSLLAARTRPAAILHAE